MKKYILFIALFAAGSLLSAQTDISLQINHKLGAADFEFNTESENDLGEAFDVTRIEYYLSTFVVYHDGGSMTSIDDLYILANGSETTTSLLGNFDISSVDSISFSVGIDEATNHLDPSIYGNGNPLGFQNPSMHWGWAAGYRFVAMEGNCGANLNEIFQIHALGDENYYSQTIVLNASANNNEILLEIDADYVSALSNVSVDGGLISHGFTGEAADLLINFRDQVFSPASTQVGINESAKVNLSLYPNPVENNGQIFFNGEVQFQSVRLIDFSGRIVEQWNEVKGSLRLDAHPSGTYFLSFITSDGEVLSKKLIIQ